MPHTYLLLAANMVVLACISTLFTPMHTALTEHPLPRAYRAVLLCTHSRPCPSAHASNECDTASCTCTDISLATPACSLAVINAAAVLLVGDEGILELMRGFYSVGIEP